MPEFQKWYNGGQADGALLSTDERELCDFYCRLLRLVSTEPCFTSGRFYDLMWVNGGIDTSKVYAYLRHTDNEAMLVVVNFDHGNGKEFRLRVPDDAVSAFCKSNAQVVELSFKAVFGDALDAKISLEQLITSGVEIKLKPQYGGIFKLKIEN